MNGESGEPRKRNRSTGRSVVKPLAADPHAPQRGVIVDQMPAHGSCW